MRASDTLAEPVAPGGFVVTNPLNWKPTYSPALGSPAIGGGWGQGAAPAIVTVNFDPSLGENAGYLKNLPDGTLILQYAERDTSFPNECVSHCKVAVWIKGCSTCDTPDIQLVFAGA